MRTRGSDWTTRPLWTLRTLRTLLSCCPRWPLIALNPGLPGFSLDTLDPLWTPYSGATLQTRVSGVPWDTLVALSCRDALPGEPLWASYTCDATCTWEPHGTSCALWARVPLYTVCASNSPKPLYAFRALWTIYR